MTGVEDVQWYSGHRGAGVRSAALYGVTRVHRRTIGHARTLCGRRLPFPFASREVRPYPHDFRCRQCSAAEAALEAAAA